MLACCLVWRCPQAAEEEEDTRPAGTAQTAKSATEIEAAHPYVLTLSPKQQQDSGLKTAPLSPFQSTGEAQAYGRVSDIKPLLDLRARYRAAQSELTIAEAVLKVARKNYERLEKLHRESIIPTRELILAESQLATEQAHQAEAARHMREVREETLQTFGEDLFKLAVAGDAPMFKGMLDHSLVLAMIALPARQALPKTVQTIKLAPLGDRDQTRQARLVGPAPRTEESTQGETWFFVAESTGLRTGMRLDAWLPLGGSSARGVLLPLSAVIWRDGQPWAYVQTGQDRFNRRPVGAHSESGGHWFVGEGFAPGEMVVVVGGQMLLSEEQRRGGGIQGGDD